ncbi:MAG TPA: M56 family metallopeptidase, partial [Chitinophagaceae bacterium]|nr:M56 family metallopeptidase [Chitinophagaceae bacterium]
ALLGIEKTVRAVVSARVDTPQVIGFLKPIILVPLACINRLDTQQVEAVLLHELIHIKRNDYLVNLFVATAEILFFFNPFVKQLITAIRREREYSCDDMVLQFQYQPQQYASALLSLERERTGSVTLGIAAGGHGQKQLLARVQRIVGIKINHHKLPQAGAWLAVVMLLGFIAMVNPVKIVEEKINPALQELAFTTRDQTRLTGNEQPLTIVNFHPAAAKELLKSGKAKGHRNDVETDDDMGSNELELQPVSSDAQDMEASPDAITIVNLEQRNFSMPEAKLVTPPPAPEQSAFSPYVPNNSFSYQFVPDTSIPRLRGETFQEKQARESLTRAKRALEQIN